MKVLKSPFDGWPCVHRLSHQELNRIRKMEIRPLPRLGVTLVSYSFFLQEAFLVLLSGENGEFFCPGQMWQGTVCFMRICYLARFSLRLLSYSQKQGSVVCCRSCHVVIKQMCCLSYSSSQTRLCKHIVYLAIRQHFVSYNI